MKTNTCVAEGAQFIDWDQVDLLVGGKTVLPDEICSLFRDFALDATHRIQELNDNLHLMEQEVLSRNAHSFKTAARSLGFVDLSNRLGHIEHLHRTPSDTEWDRIITQLEFSLVKSMAALEKRHPSLAE